MIEDLNIVNNEEKNNGIQKLNNIEEVKNLEERHKKWLANIQNGVVLAGGFTVGGVSILAELFAAFATIGHALEGNLDKTLASLGAVVLANALRKLSVWAMRKGLSDKSEIGKNILEQDKKNVHQKKLNKIINDFSKNPEEVKRFLDEVQRKIENIEKDEKKI